MASTPDRSGVNTGPRPKPIIGSATAADRGREPKEETVSDSHVLKTGNRLAGLGRSEVNEAVSQAMHEGLREEDVPHAQAEELPGRITQWKPRSKAAATPSWFEARCMICQHNGGAAGRAFVRRRPEGGGTT